MDMLRIFLWGIKHFQGFKRVSPRRIFRKSNIPSLTQNYNTNKNNSTSTGYAPHLPLGIKHFQCFKKPLPKVGLKVQYTSTKTLNGKNINWTPTGYAPHLP